MPGTPASERDVAADMSGLALRVVSRALFGAELDEDALAISRDVAEVGEFFDYLTIALFPVLMRTPLPRVRRFRAGIDHLERETARVIAGRRSAAADENGDLLSILLAARDVEGDGTGMSDEQIRDEARHADHRRPRDDRERAHVDVVPAGPHPEVEERLHAELEAVLDGRSPSAADAASLRYTEAVLLESMRLYPPAWGIERRAVGRPGDRRLRHPCRRGGADADIRRSTATRACTRTRCGSTRSGSWARPRPSAPTGPTRCSGAGRASASESGSRCSRRCSWSPSWRGGSGCGSIPTGPSCRRRASRCGRATACGCVRSARAA